MVFVGDGTDQPKLLVTLGMGDKLAERAGFDDSIVVQEPDVICALSQRIPHADIIPARVTQVAAVLDQGELRVGVLDLSLRAVAGPVVDDDRMSVRIVKLGNRFEAFERVAETVPVQDDNEYSRRWRLGHGRHMRVYTDEINPSRPGSATRLGQ